MRRINVYMLSLFVIAFCVGCQAQIQKPTCTSVEMESSALAGDTVDYVPGEVRGIVEDSKGNMWFATNGDGVYKYDGHSIVNYTEKHGLSSNYTWIVKEDKSGNMWFKTSIYAKDEIAICRFDGHAFETIQSEVSNSTIDYRKGELIFDYCYDGQKLVKMEVPKTSPSQNEQNVKHHYDIYDVLKDSKGNIWFGTCTAGICKYDGSSYIWFDNPELGAAIRKIFEDHNGTIWAGNNGDGLFRFEGNNFISFSREKNLHNPDFERYPIGKPGLMSRVWSIAEDQQGQLWICTIDNGVWLYNGTKVKNYTTRNGLGIDSVWTVYCNKKGVLWFGTEGDGVYLFNGKKFEKFSLEKKSLNKDK